MYDYEIFLSYTRVKLVEDWIHDHFLPIFSDFLELDLGYTPRVFVDTRNVVPGDSWPERLQSALAKSKCMVALWSPRYFKSLWCRYECAAMQYREQQLGYRTSSSPKGLIYPINIRDGDRFPDFTRARTQHAGRNIRTSPAREGIAPVSFA